MLLTLHRKLLFSFLVKYINSIDQKWGDYKHPLEGNTVTPRILTRTINKLLDAGAYNINWVGGEPTPNIHSILAVLSQTDVNVIQLWNSNMTKLV